MYGNTNYYTSRHFGAPYAPGTKLYNNLENLFRPESAKSIIYPSKQVARQWHFVLRRVRWNKTGIVATSGYTRDNISVAGTAKLSKWMNVEASLNYANSTNTKVDRGTGGVLYRAMNWPVTDDMRVYLDPAGNIRYPNKYADVDILNPYFDLYKNKNYDETQRLFLMWS